MVEGVGGVLAFSSLLTTACSLLSPSCMEGRWEAARAPLRSTASSFCWEAARPEDAGRCLGWGGMAPLRSTASSFWEAARPEDAERCLGMAPRVEELGLVAVHQVVQHRTLPKLAPRGGTTDTRLDPLGHKTPRRVYLTDPTERERKWMCLGGTRQEARGGQSEELAMLFRRSWDCRLVKHPVGEMCVHEDDISTYI